MYEVASDPKIWEQHPCSDRYKKEVFLKFFEDSIQSKGSYIIIDKKSNKVIGSTRFKPVNKVENAIEIGWSFLSRDRWGGTYNKAHKKLMIDYAFRYVDHIIFYIDKQNIRSQKSVSKLGAKEIVAPAFKNLVNHNQDCLSYRIGKESWVIKNE